MVVGYCVVPLKITTEVENLGPRLASDLTYKAARNFDEAGIKVGLSFA